MIKTNLTIAALFAMIFLFANQCSAQSQLLTQQRTTKPFAALLNRPVKVPGGGHSIFGLVTTASGPNLPVLGSGTIGRLPKWAGITSTNSFIADTTIFEDKNGFVGVGTDSPASKLSVAGTIQSLSGGFKFPDGTTQTSAFQPTQVVTSLNALTGAVTLAAGDNISISPSGNTLTIASSNSLTSVAHDSTLTGSGTVASPLGVAVPLRLLGSVSVGSVFDAVLKSTNFAPGGIAVTGIGGGEGSTGVAAIGGNSITGGAGPGVNAQGGGTLLGSGGAGVITVGGVGSGAGNQSGDGIFALGAPGANGATNGFAGNFFGDVNITGNLSKGGGSFKIDHPLDPENKYLYHSFVESPDMKNIYDGTVITDASGDATVTLPEWFEALNRDFRYQLTVIGTFAQAIVSEKINNNRFTIKTSVPGVEVSWQVTGIRQDAYANKHRIPIEESKPERERGSYLHPDSFNQPESRGVEWTRHPQQMQNLEQQRLKAEQKLNQNKRNDR